MWMSNIRVSVILGRFLLLSRESYNLIILIQCAFMD